MYFKGFHKILHVLVLIFSYVGLETCKKYPNLGILTLFFFYIQNKRLPCEQHDTTAASQQVIYIKGAFIKEFLYGG
jgi:hypothetical protein